MSSPSPSNCSLTIAFDIDGTIDRDPVAWQAIAALLMQRGHKCIIVTGREQPAEKLLRLHINPLFTTIIVSGPLLKEEAARRAGFNVDIWIDVMPGMIQRCQILSGDLGSENVPDQAREEEAL